ncbi:MAG: hypothetical protein A2428_05400 [Bdellovibrionales bacterium RIFOXYC1_FULL_54_43]|nr:MAG: hypothetical protein A2428_05400 [Bdellovibrionales bacterium RIFOXYC1_FULL_54_43]OFZ81480.1 MAG: hypothetical protein A2603_07060 [Bdellovibrionales bacterium RIFOXYD1_FULL_55_31]
MTLPLDALKGLADCLPVGACLSDSETLDRYGRSTAFWSTRPLAVVLPTRREEVQKIVQVANQHGLALYPVSQGKNWGYGDACAPSDHQVIVDLSRMNRILEINRTLGYAVIEAGVTQGQLSKVLAEQKTGLWLDATGAGTSASILGNTVERGFGHTRYGDHFATTCGMEIVLPTGQILETGFGHYPAAKARHCFPYGVGPAFDGLFCQSNYGIITRIAIWLMPQPEAFCAFFFRNSKDDSLPYLVDQLRRLRMQGILTSSVHIANDLRAFSSRAEYPWKECGNETRLSTALRQQLRKKHFVGAWNGTGALYGTRRTVRAAFSEVKKALRGNLVLGFNDRSLGVAEKVVGGLTALGINASAFYGLRIIRPLYGLLKGIPSDDPLKGAFWRCRKNSFINGEIPSGFNLRDSDAGVVWISPVVPATGENAVEVERLIAGTFEKHGFDPLITFTLINERSLTGIVNMAFDRTNAEETRRAAACYDETLSGLIDAGYIPYRTGMPGFKKLHQYNSPFWELARQIKKTIDPNQVIAPGRYIPS